MNDRSTVISSFGVTSPRLLYGTAWKRDRTGPLVASALRLGFRGIDTACQPKHYDEAGVGAGVAACLDNRLRREDLYLQTKFTSVSGHDPARIPYDTNAPLSTQVEQSFAVSLRNLRTDYLDCLVLHSPMGTDRQMTEVWRAMEAIFDGSRARQLGISNCYDLAALEKLCKSARIRPAVVQNRFYATTGHDRDIRAFCRRHGLIYQSFWTLTGNPEVLAHATVRSLASRYGRSPAQILFRYLTQQAVVPLTGTTSEDHMRADLAIFEFELGADELDAMTALF